MDKSTISYDRMTQCANELRKASSDMKTILDVDLTNYYSKIGTEEVWSGEAADAAKAEFDSLKSHFEEFYNAISECAQFLDKVVEAYQTVDKKIISNN